MKYTGNKMAVESSRLASSVQTWLGQELETRGIDAVVYTRYIISILQQESFDIGDDEIYASTKSDVTRSDPAGWPRDVHCGSRDRKRKKRRSQEIDDDQLKKSAALQCLQSVCDENNGLEQLVEEVYVKLQEGGTRNSGDPSVNSKQTDSGGSQDPTERYCAAFPSLGGASRSPVYQPPPAVDKQGQPWAEVASRPRREKCDVTAAETAALTQTSIADGRSTNEASPPQRPAKTPGRQTEESAPDPGPPHGPRLTDLEDGARRDENGACTKYHYAAAPGSRCGGDGAPSKYHPTASESDVTRADCPPDDHISQSSAAPAAEPARTAAQSERLGTPPAPTISPWAHPLDCPAPAFIVPKIEVTSRAPKHPESAAVGKHVQPDVPEEELSTHSSPETVVVASCYTDPLLGVETTSPLPARRLYRRGSGESAAIFNLDLTTLFDDDESAGQVDDILGVTRLVQYPSFVSTSPPVQVLHASQDDVIFGSSDSEDAAHDSFDEKSLFRLSMSSGQMTSPQHEDDSGHSSPLMTSRGSPLINQSALAEIWQQSDKPGARADVTVPDGDGGENIWNNILWGLDNNAIWTALKSDVREDSDGGRDALLRSLSVTLSPKHERHGFTNLYRLWDVNVQRRLEFDPVVRAPNGRERSNTIEQIQKYLLHLTFGDESHTSAGLRPKCVFIEGGLYGPNPWNKLLGDEGPSELYGACEELFQEEEDALWSGFSLYPPDGVYRSASEETPCVSRPRGLADIRTSENSAFKDTIPRKLTHLPHVSSAPALQTSVPECGKLVQVKHLYKSDTSIMSQLGLVESQPQPPIVTQLQYSPERHFKPISSQDDVTAGPRGADPPAEEPEPALCAHASQVQATPLGRTSSYQLYEPEDDGFVPRFRLRRGQHVEKCLQTGSSVEEEPEDCLMARIISDVRDVLLLDDEVTDTEVKVTAAEVKVTAGDASAAEESCAVELGAGGVASLWADADAGAGALTSKYSSIWSRGTDQDLPSVPGSASASHHGSLHDPGQAAAHARPGEASVTMPGPPAAATLALGDGPVWLPRHEFEIQSTEPVWSCGDDVVGGQGSAWDHSSPEDLVLCDDSAIPEWAYEVCVDSPAFKSTPPDSTSFADQDPAAENEAGNESEAVPVLFSFDLEEQWLGHHGNANSQKTNNNKKCKLAPAQKPCTFFMEGACRRADCKFAHDVSSITCRFWQEDACFKGDTCPFLHGQPTPSDDSSPGNSAKDDDFKLNKSEFPSLGKAKDSPRKTPRARHSRRRVSKSGGEERARSYRSYRRRERPGEAARAPSGGEGVRAPPASDESPDETAVRRASQHRRHR